MLRKIIVSGFGLVLIGLSRLAFNTVALNSFGEEVAGRLNVALSLAILAALPIMTSVGAPTVRFIAASRGAGNDARVSWLIRLFAGLVAIVGAAIAVFIVVGQEWIAKDRGIDVSLVQLALFVCLSYGLYQFLRSVLYALDRFGAYGAFESLGALAFFGTLGASAVLNRPKLSLVAFAAAYLVFCVAALINVRKELTRAAPESSRGGIGGILAFAGFALMGSTASMGTREIAVLWAPDAMPMAEVAYLGLCISFLGPLQFMPKVVRTVIFVESAEHSGRGDDARVASTLSEFNHWLLLANIPMCGAAILLAGPILERLGGVPTPDHVVLLQILIASALVEIAGTPAINALPGAGYVRVPALGSITGLIGAVVVWVVALPGLGAIGIALGLLASAVLKTSIPIVYARRKLGARMTRRPVVVAGSLALLLAGVILGTQWPYPFAITGGLLISILALGWSSYVELFQFARARILEKLRRPQPLSGETQSADDS